MGALLPAVTSVSFAFSRSEAIISKTMNLESLLISQDAVLLGVLRPTLAKIK
jgi:hypothetical protein